MVVARSVVLTMFIYHVSFPKYSISEKPEKCIKRKQYWSTSSVISSKGACVKCPPNWRTCFEQPIADQASCVRSCRVNPTPKPNSKTNPTKMVPFQPTPSTTVNSNGSLAVVYQSAKHPPEINEGQKLPVVKESLGKEIWIAVGCGLFVLILMIVAIVLYHKIQPDWRRDEAGGRNARNQGILDLEPLHNERNDPELQEEPHHPSEINADAVPAGRIEEEEQIGLQEEELSAVRIGGIQDTEKPASFSSSLNVDQNYY